MSPTHRDTIHARMLMQAPVIQSYNLTITLQNVDMSAFQQSNRRNLRQ